MIRNVKPPRNLKGSCNILGDLGCELGPIVRLEGGRHSKPGEDFSKNKASTVGARLLVVRKVLSHPENVSTKTRRNLTLFMGGMWVKSTCQSCVGRCLRIWWVGKGGGQMLVSGAALGTTNKIEAWPQTPLLIPQARTRDEGVRPCNSDLFLPLLG